MSFRREEIKRAREARGWSQGELADRSGVSLRLIQGFESDATVVADENQLRMILSILEIDPEAGGDDPSEIFGDATAIFENALRISGEQEREEFLRTTCHNDGALIELIKRRIVDEPLVRHDCSPGASPDLVDVTVGTVIDRYKLLEKIGEGGFGVVYMARQLEPVRRRVALKIIRHEMVTKEAVARFEAERQALARMRHPNIAQVYDAGSTETGRPFFVMELVKGDGILKYCDNHQLTAQSRLKLFTEVCGAIQHAHEKGIIHRDIKPSNIMVTLNGDDPVPKVIDFGIAEAMGEDLTDKTLFTSFDEFIGTPAYMAPEQMRESDSASTRSDIYSLGVLLYELLTGRPPFDPAKLRRAALDSIRKIVCEEDPPVPSSRLSSLSGEELTQIATHRSSKPERLLKLIHGELDWIIMKAMSKRAENRYESAASLSQDVGRYLRNEPIIAAGPSPFYALRKLARKYRAAVVVTMTITGLILVGGIVSAWLAIAYKNQLVRTELAEKNAIETAQSRWLKTGEDFLDRRDSTGALLPFIRALELEQQKESGDESIHRLRIASVSRTCPRIVRMWFQDRQINSVSFSADGDRVISAGNNGAVTVYPVAVGNPIPYPTHVRDAQSAFLYSPSGMPELLLSAGDDGKVFIRELPDQKPPAFDHDDKVFNARLDERGERVLTSCFDGLARIWSTSDHKVLQTFSHADFWQEYNLHLVSAEEINVPAGVRSQEIQIARLDGQLSIRVFDEKGDAVMPAYAIKEISIREEAEINPGEPTVIYLATKQDNSVHVRLVDPMGKHIVDSPAEELFPDSDRLEKFKATVTELSSTDRDVRKLARGKIIADITDQIHSPGDCVETRRLENLLADHWEKNEVPASLKVEVIRSVTALFGRAPDILDAQFSPSGHLATAGKAGNALIWDPLAPEKPLHELPHTSWVYSVNFSPDGKRVVTASFDRSAIIWDAQSGDLIHRLVHPFGVQVAEFSPDGRYVVTACMDYMVRVWEVDTGQMATPPMRHEAYVLDAAFGPDGRRIATGTVNGVIRVWDLASTNWMPDSNDSAGEIGAPAWTLREVKGGGIVVPGQGFSAETDGNVVVINDPDGPDGRREWKSIEPLSQIGFNPKRPGQVALVGRTLAWLWDFQSSKPVQLAHENPQNEPDFHIEHAEFSQDGRYFVTACTDPDLNRLYAKIWTTSDGEMLGQPLYHNDGVRHATFSQDSKSLLTSGEDKVAVTWSITSSGAERFQEYQQPNEVYASAFSPDGRLITGYGRDSGTRVWETETGVPVTEWRFGWAGDKLEARALFLDDRTISVRKTEQGEKLDSFIWELASESRPVDDLIKEAGLLYSRIFSDPDGSAAPTTIWLNEKDLEVLWQEIQSEPWVTSLDSNQRKLDWHLTEVRNATARLKELSNKPRRDDESILRAAAAFHLDKARLLTQADSEQLRKAEKALEDAIKRLAR